LAADSAPTAADSPRAVDAAVAVVADAAAVADGNSLAVPAASAGEDVPATPPAAVRETLHGVAAVASPKGFGGHVAPGRAAALRLARGGPHGLGVRRARHR